MADYSTIKGFNVLTLASDPAATKGSWASGGALNTPRSQTAGIGTPTAAMSAGGNSPATRDFSETYDGTSWTEGNNLNTARRNAKGAGSTTAGLVVGGLSPPGGVITATETYDGTSWSTSPASLTRAGGTAQFAIAGASSTSALIFGGEPGTTYNAYSETWNGTAWTEGNNLTTGRSQLAGAGTVTAALGAGGYPDSAKIESYDGTSWTEIAADLGTARYKLGGSGTSTASLVYGGQTSGTSHYTKTESYNGSTWTEVADLATANYGMGNAQAPTNTNTLALAIAGYAPSFSTITEEWSIAPSIAQEGQVWYNSSTNVLKGFGAQGTGAWASGGTMNDGRTYVGGLGTSQSAGMIVGGGPPAGLGGVKTESYDGTTWTEEGDMIGGRSDLGTSVGGSPTAALVFGGDGRSAIPAQPQTSALTESYNGTAWSEVNDLNTALRNVAGAGTQTAALSLGGQISPTTIPTSVTETWDGTSWTNGNGFINTQRSAAAGFGTATAGLIACGRVPPAGASNGSVFTESYDGTSWSAVNDANQQRYLGGEAGTQGGGLLIAGETAGDVCESWDGTCWSTIAALASAVRDNAGFGTSIAGLSGAGGYPGLATSFEFTVPGAIKTFTAS